MFYTAFRLMMQVALFSCIKTAFVLNKQQGPMSGRSGEKFLISSEFRCKAEALQKNRWKTDYCFFWFLESFGKRHKVNLVIAKIILS